MASIVFPAAGQAAPVTETTPRPTPTYKACHICDEGLPEAVAHIILFWMDGCPQCEEVLQSILPLLQESYGQQLEIRMVEVVDLEDVEALYRIAASYGLAREQTHVPFLIIGDVVLTGSAEVRERLPALIDYRLLNGGVDWPVNPILAEVLQADQEAPNPADSRPASSASISNNGFALAIAIMVGMAIVLLYSIISFAIGKTYYLPVWADWFIPALIVIGIGVAGYLSTIETQSISAICGPVGDCNTVQQSRYARLFDVLPIGILGLIGYLALLTAWLGRKFIRRLEKPAAVGFWGMAFFAVLFSLYLTYLEPFVIKAVCIWCLTSAVIVTLLLLLGTPPVVRQFSPPEEDD